MRSAHDVAAYIVEELGPVTPMNLQKLLYYCQAWHLVCRAEPLFAEAILAWDHGPVIEEVWRITAGSRELVGVWPQGRASNVEVRAEEVVRATLAQYGSLTAAQLRRCGTSTPCARPTRPTARPCAWATAWRCACRA